MTDSFIIWFRSAIFVTNFKGTKLLLICNAVTTSSNDAHHCMRLIRLIYLYFTSILEIWITMSFVKLFKTIFVMAFHYSLKSWQYAKKENNKFRYNCSIHI
jgi:hypothetical protein